MGFLEKVFLQCRVLILSKCSCVDCIIGKITMGTISLVGDDFEEEGNVVGNPTCSEFLIG